MYIHSLDPMVYVLLAVLYISIFSSVFFLPHCSQVRVGWGRRQMATPLPLLHTRSGSSGNRVERRSQRSLAGSLVCWSVLDSALYVHANIYIRRYAIRYTYVYITWYSNFMHVHMSILLQILPLCIWIYVLGTCTLYLQKHDVCIMYVHVHMYLTCTCTVYSICMTLIGVHELRGPIKVMLLICLPLTPSHYLAIYIYLTVSPTHPVTSL